MHDVDVGGVELHGDLLRTAAANAVASHAFMMYGQGKQIKLRDVKPG
jgi:hypothetical protein